MWDSSLRMLYHDRKSDMAREAVAVGGKSMGQQTTPCSQSGSRQRWMLSLAFSLFPGYLVQDLSTLDASHIQDWPSHLLNLSVIILTDSLRAEPPG